ncbi:MAG: hypothetical protein WBA57_08740 [Elainellaceae cyanobacterium]
MNPITAFFRWLSRFWKAQPPPSPLILTDIYKTEIKTARIVRVSGVHIPGVVMVYRLIPPAPMTQQLAIHLVDIGLLRQQSAKRATRVGEGLPGTGKRPYEQEYQQWCEIYSVDHTHTTHAICVLWLLPSYDARRQITKPIEIIPGNLQHPQSLGNLAAIALTQKLAFRVAQLPDYPDVNRPWTFYVDRFDWVDAIERIAEYDYGPHHVFQRKIRR